MQQTTKTFLTTDDGKALAIAIRQLGYALRCSGDDTVAARLEAVDAACDRVINLTFPERPRPAPAPSCNAPHCDCGEGEDCKANGAAEKDRDAWWSDYESVALAALGVTDAKLGSPQLQAELASRKLEKAHRDACDAALRHAPESAALRYATQLPRAIGDGPRRFVVTVDANEVSIDNDLRPFDVAPVAVAVATLPPGTRIDTNALHPDLAARLDGLKAAVDALAEHLDRKAEVRKENVRYVNPTSTRVVSGQGIVWIVDTRSSRHACEFGIGDRVARGDVTGDTMIVTGIASHGDGPLIGLTVRKAEG